MVIYLIISVLEECKDQGDLEQMHWKWGMWVRRGEESLVTMYCKWKY